MTTYEFLHKCTYWLSFTWRIYSSKEPLVPVIRLCLTAASRGFVPLLVRSCVPQKHWYPCSSMLLPRTPQYKSAPLLHACHHGVLDSTPGQSMRDLWWKIDNGTGFSSSTSFSPVSIIPPMLHTSISFIFHPHYRLIILAIDGIMKWSTSLPPLFTTLKASCYICPLLSVCFDIPDTVVHGIKSYYKLCPVSARFNVTVYKSKLNASHDSLHKT